MKKFSLNLEKYEVEVQVPVTKEDGSRELEDKMQVYPLRENLNAWLRAPGIFRTGEEIVESVTLAKAVRDCGDDSYVVDEREAQVLKDCVNKHLALTEEGKSNLGGPIHEEAICRIFSMKEVE